LANNGRSGNIRLDLAVLWLNPTDASSAGVWVPNELENPIDHSSLGEVVRRRRFLKAAAIGLGGLFLPSSARPAQASASILFSSRRGGGESGVFNVRDRGTDQSAIQATIDEAPDGAIIYFDPGVQYTIKDNTAKGVEVVGRNRLTFYGPGAIIKRVGPPNAQRWMTVEDCNDIRFDGLHFDANNIDRYGGIDLTNCTEIRFHGCKFFDSNLSPSWITYDHHGIVAKYCRGLWVTNCHAEDVELCEADASSRVRIVGNTSLRAAGSIAIAMLPIKNGQTAARDNVIKDNVLIDPRKVAINLAHEAYTADILFRDVKIVDNRIVHDNISGGTAIQIGFFVSGKKPTGCEFSGLTIEGNDCIINHGIVRSSQEIWVRSSQEGTVFSQSSFSRNRVINRGIHKLETPIRLDRVRESVIAGNRIFGAPSYGLGFVECKDNEIYKNIVRAEDVAYIMSSSLGGNRIRDNRILGCPKTEWDLSGLHETDHFQD
jgi:hypothetical protein